jgi:hypothetical protein
MKKFLTLLLLLFLLLIFHETAITGAQNGLLLWYQTLIPSLLPFILITNALSETGAYQAVSRHFKNSSTGYEIMAIVLGSLCGYPIGAKIINDFILNEYITPAKGNKILAFASQASPMFLMGYVYLHIIKKGIPLWLFLGSIYFPPLILYPLFICGENTTFPGKTQKTRQTVRITDTFLHAVQIMVMIGLYVMIFSILLEILLPFCPFKSYKIALSLLEITNGLKILEQLSLPFSLKISLICSLSAFGGFCSAFQIRSVLDYPGASIKKYLQNKIIFSAGTFLIIQSYLLL